MDSVYLARPLWRHISRYADASRCLKCELPADYVQAVIMPGPSADKPFTGHFRRASAYCRAHVQAVAKRRGLACMDTKEQLEGFIAEQTRERDAHYAALREQQRLREEATMAEFGRVLQLSGYKGRLYRLVDGSPECQMNDGTTMRPCCWREGVRLIDNRVGGREAEPGHNEDCPAQAGRNNDTP